MSTPSDNHPPPIPHSTRPSLAAIRPIDNGVGSGMDALTDKLKALRCNVQRAPKGSNTTEGKRQLQFVRDGILALFRFKIPPAVSAAKVSSYLVDGLGPSIDDFRLFYEGTMKNKWNKALVDVAFADLHEKRPSYDSIVLRQEIQNRISYLHTKYHYANNKPLGLVQADLKADRQRVRRVGTAKRHIETVSQLPVTSQFTGILELAPDELGSDDESDHGEDYFTGGYIARIVSWRSAELNQLLMDIDNLSVLLRYNSYGGRGPGAIGRVRHRVAGFMEKRARNAPFTFPRNCYNEAWINTLCGEDRVEFEAQCGACVSLQMDASIKHFQRSNAQHLLSIISSILTIGVYNIYT